MFYSQINTVLEYYYPEGGTSVQPASLHHQYACAICQSLEAGAQVLIPEEPTRCLVQGSHLVHVVGGVSQPCVQISLTRDFS